MNTVHQVCTELPYSKEVETVFFAGLPGWLSGASACQCRSCKRLRLDLWVRKSHWRRQWQSTPIFLPGKSHGQRSLVGYSPCGPKKLDVELVKISDFRICKLILPELC